MKQFALLIALILLVVPALATSKRRNPAPHWHCIANFEGSGMKNTDTFAIPKGNVVNLVWESIPRSINGQAYPGTLFVMMNKPDEEIGSTVIDATGSDSGVSRIYKSGTFYFKITSTENWKICILIRPH